MVIVIVVVVSLLGEGDKVFFPNSWFSFRVLVGFKGFTCTGVGGQRRWGLVVGLGASSSSSSSFAKF